jgi:hypothetical protein
MPIFFHGLSVRILGLGMGRLGSLAGGVVGGVMGVIGSSTVGLDCGLLDSSVRLESALALEKGPEARFPTTWWTALRDRFVRPA